MGFISLLRTNVLISILTVTILSSSFQSCCRENDEESGDIVSTTDIGNYRDYVNQGCYNFPDTICIRNDSVFKSVFTITSSNKECNELVLPSIDFSQNTLLVYNRSDNGRVKYHREVKIDTANKTVTYMITLADCYCVDKCESSSLNMVLIPKIPGDYIVHFK